MDTNKPVHEFEDILFVGFLEYRGHTVMPCKKPGGQVLFEVIGDITGDIEAYYLNEKIGVLNYGRILKNLEKKQENLGK